MTTTELAPFDRDTLLPFDQESVDQHATCQHVAQRLTCEQFDQLVARSGGACEICGRTGIRLHMDHDHAKTRFAYGGLRGLVCRKCNSLLSYVDRGLKQPDERVLRYLAIAEEWADRMAPTTVRELPDWRVSP